MRKCLLISVLSAAFFGGAFNLNAAVAGPTPVSCSLCRDVYQHPEDYANHAYNQVFGENPTLSFAAGDLLKIVAPNGQWAIVDLNYIIQPTGLSLNIIILSYSISLPNGKIEMVVQNPRGGFSRYQAFTHSPDLIVGPDPAPVANDPVQPPITNPLPPKKASSHNGGLELICCQPGAYYWSIEQIGYGMQFGSE